MCSCVYLCACLCVCVYLCVCVCVCVFGRLRERLLGVVFGNNCAMDKANKQGGGWLRELNQGTKEVIML